MVDQLAADYAAAGQPVLILEQNIQHQWLGDGIRYNRFKAAVAPPYNYPLVIVDSGYQATQASKSDYYASYKKLIDAELNRAPQAEVSATMWREGNHLEFEVKVTNQSGVTLSRAENDATVTVILYQEVTPFFSESLTSRMERAVVYQGIENPLANDATGIYSLRSADLSESRLKSMRAVALVDYRPGGTSGAYHMLQAAVANAPSFEVTPSSLSFTAGPDDVADPGATLAISAAPEAQSWAVTATPDWVTVTPASSGVAENIEVRVRLAALKPGMNSGTILITSALFPAQPRSIPIQVSYTPPPMLTLSRQEIRLMIDSKAPADQELTVEVNGYPDGLAWSVTGKPAWVTVTPSTGVVGAPAVVRVQADQLQAGENVGEIQFSASTSGKDLVQKLPIQVRLADVRRFYLPSIYR